MMTRGINPATETSPTQRCVQVHAGEHPKAPQNALLDGASLFDFAITKSGNGIKNANPQKENGAKESMKKSECTTPAINALKAARDLE